MKFLENKVYCMLNSSDYCHAIAIPTFISENKLVFTSIMTSSNNWIYEDDTWIGKELEDLKCEQIETLKIKTTDGEKVNKKFAIRTVFSCKGVYKK